jgi:hypothetical protein
MKTVDSLPEKIIEQGNRYMYFHPRAILIYMLPIFAFYLAPYSVNENETGVINRIINALIAFNKPLLIILCVYAFLIFFSKLSKMLWKFDKPQWFKYYLSLIFAVSVAVFCKHFNFNYWLLNDYGYLTDSNITSWVALSAFIPMLAAHLDSFRSVELAFYKSKGFNYTGRISRRFHI